VIVRTLLNLKQSSIQRIQYGIHRAGEGSQLRLKGIIELTRALRMTRIKRFPGFISLCTNNVIKSGLNTRLNLPVPLPAFTARDSLHANS
jgi:hypothetical protein